VTAVIAVTWAAVQAQCEELQFESEVMPIMVGRYRLGRTHQTYDPLLLVQVDIRGVKRIRHELRQRVRVIAGQSRSVGGDHRQPIGQDRAKRGQGAMTAARKPKAASAIWP
jgi:hypothetical protein